MFGNSVTSQGDSTTTSINTLDFSKANDWQGTFAALPPNDYPVTITKAEFSTNKNQTGKYLKLEFSLIGEKYKNRKLFNNYNLIHTNQQAAAIAMSEVKEILKCIGTDIAKAQFNEDGLIGYLMDKTLMLRVGIKQDEKYGPQNVIKEYGTYSPGENIMTNDETPF